MSKPPRPTRLPTSRGRSAARNERSKASDPIARHVPLRPPIRGLARSAQRPRLVLSLSPSTGKRFVPFLRRHLRRAHAILNPALCEFSLALVGDARMASLHEQFLGIPGPTDVLTFPLDHDDRGRVTAGEVVVCVPEAVRRAKVEGQTTERELLLYALHGMLHLCGYDDRTARDYRRMHRTEDMILTKLGIGPVFAPASPPPEAGVLPASGLKRETPAGRPRHGKRERR